MLGWCKARENYTARLIDGSEIRFVKNGLYPFTQFGDFYNVDNGIDGGVDLFNKIFYRNFMVTIREASYYEANCKVKLTAYKQMGREEEQCYMAYSDYKDNYFDWLSELYSFKDGLAFQELLDFYNDEIIFDSKTSEKLSSDLKKHCRDAEQYQGELGEIFIDLYKTMMKAFEFASDDGKIVISL